MVENYVGLAMHQVVWTTINFDVQPILNRTGQFYNLSNHNQIVNEILLSVEVSSTFLDATTRR